MRILFLIVDKFSVQQKPFWFIGCGTAFENGNLGSQIFRTLFDSREDQGNYLDFLLFDYISQAAGGNRA